jgi:Toprim domain/CHC2 zinc finger
MLPAATIEAAKARSVESVIAEFAVELRPRGRSERVGPCPRCGGTDRFSINITKQVFNCRKCAKGGDAIALMQFITNTEFREACERLAGTSSIDRKIAPILDTIRAEEAAAYERNQLRKAVSLWRKSAPIQGTIAEGYLRCARSYTGRIPATLRFLAGGNSYLPTMVGAFGIRKVTGVHFTRLTPDGRKADVERPKTFLGASSGSPIIIAPPNDLLGLAVTEGIEDALSAHQATGLGAWAAGAADRMPKLAAAIPAYIEAVTIYGHSDESGQRNAYRLAAALDARGIEIRLEGLP